MISLENLKKNYPPKLQSFSLGILREYIQYKILESIYNSKYQNKLVFLGGTALRIVYNSQRFSEDLDFDNLNCSEKEFEELSKHIQRSLEQEGYEVEIRNVYKDAFHCYIKIPKVLFVEGLSALPAQKIHIRIDVAEQRFDFTPKTFLLDRFDVYQNIKVVSKELLLSQKIVAFLKRKVTKGRDIFDISYLLSDSISPNMDFIEQKLGISSQKKLKSSLIDHTTTLDLDLLSKDVEPFLFNPKQVDRIKNIQEQIQGY